MTNARLRVLAALAAFVSGGAACGSEALAPDIADGTDATNADAGGPRDGASRADGATDPSTDASSDGGDGGLVDGGLDGSVAWSSTPISVAPPAFGAGRVVAHPTEPGRLLVEARFMLTGEEVGLAAEWTNGALGPILAVTPDLGGIGVLTLTSAYAAGVPYVLFANGDDSRVARFEGEWKHASIGTAQQRPVQIPSSVSWPLLRTGFSRAGKPRVLAYGFMAIVDVAKPEAPAWDVFTTSTVNLSMLDTATTDGSQVLVTTSSPIAMRWCTLAHPFVCDAELAGVGGAFGTAWPIWTRVHPATDDVVIVLAGTTGTGDRLLRSTTRGANLAPIAWPSNAPSTLRALAMHPKNAAVMVARMQLAGGLGEFRLTTDGGATWTTLPSPLTAKALGNVTTQDELAIDASGTLFFPYAPSGGGVSLLYSRAL